MENKLQLFNFNGQQVRTVTIDDEPYFVGKDVAEILGYANTRDALSKHVDSEDKNTVAIHDGIKRGNPNQTVI
ncbi:BRO-N domain-containing protein, partial [Limosilactobacillus fermentum]